MAQHRIPGGTPVTLRPADRAVFLAAFRNLSDRSRHLRFHKLDPRLRETDIAHLTEVDQVDHAALAVFSASVLDENRPARAMLEALARPLCREGPSWLYRLSTDPACPPDTPLAGMLRARDAAMTRRITPSA